MLEEVWRALLALLVGFAVYWAKDGGRWGRMREELLEELELYEKLEVLDRDGPQGGLREEFHRQLAEKLNAYVRRPPTAGRTVGKLMVALAISLVAALAATLAAVTLLPESWPTWVLFFVLIPLGALNAWAVDRWVWNRPTVIELGRLAAERTTVHPGTVTESPPPTESPEDPEDPRP